MLLDASHSGLRAHDVHQGLQVSGLDRGSGLLGRELFTTQEIGMAAALASWIKGQDVLDVESLREFAANQLDINTFAFDRVVQILAELEFVRGLTLSGHRVKSFFESVPEMHETMYGRLGAKWSEQGPTEIESSLLGTVEQLSRGPAAVDELDVDPKVRQKVLDLGSRAEAIRLINVAGREIAYSPFFSIEQPTAVEAALKTVDLVEVQRAIRSVRDHQGLPLSVAVSGSTLNKLVGAGLMAGPALKRADGTSETFAVAPYGLSPELRSIKRPILDKAQAMVAAMRMGEHFGTVTKLRYPALVLHKLKSGYVAAAHTDTPRQWAMLYRLGVVEFVPQGSLKGIRLVRDKHGDNEAAVQIAIDLLEHGEAADAKEWHDQAAQSLLVEGRYLTPIQGVREARQREELADEDYTRIIETLMGRSLP
jgi:hypothetical protein